MIRKIPNTELYKYDLCTPKKNFLPWKFTQIITEYSPTKNEKIHSFKLRKLCDIIQ